MIDIKNEEDCCGCAACMQRCPKQCITMQSNEKGFLYPLVNTTQCINCGLCEKVCPIINQSEPHEPIEIFAAKNKDEEIRRQSSSGGVFTMLAEETIKKGGVVFGVKFNKKWQPEFDFTETIEGITPFRGSKYIQAIVGNAYIKAEEFLKVGREVLFSGTPCQIAGLKKYLRKEYENILYVSIACHGVPSPLVWEEYLNFKGINIADIASVSMRNKEFGWRNYQLYIESKSGHCLCKEKKYECSYLHGFIRSLYLRPSCYACKFKEGRCGCDLLIADFWGIEDVIPLYNDDKGTSLIVTYSTKALDIAKSMNFPYTINKEQAFNKNHCIIHSTPKNEYSPIFWDLWKKEKYNANNKLLKQFRTTKYKRIINKIKSIFQ